MLLAQPQVLCDRHFDFEIDDHVSKSFVVGPEANVADEVGDHVHLFFFVGNIPQNQAVVVEFEALVTRPGVSGLFDLGVKALNQNGFERINHEFAPLATRSCKVPSSSQYALEV